MFRILTLIILIAKPCLAITVTNSGDGNPPGQVTLRQALSMVTATDNVVTIPSSINNIYLTSGLYQEFTTSVTIKSLGFCTIHGAIYSGPRFYSKGVSLDIDISNIHFTQSLVVFDFSHVSVSNCHFSGMHPTYGGCRIAADSENLNVTLDFCEVSGTLEDGMQIYTLSHEIEVYAIFCDFLSALDDGLEIEVRHGFANSPITANLLFCSSVDAGSPNYKGSNLNIKKEGIGTIDVDLAAIDVSDATDTNIEIKDEGVGTIWADLQSIDVHTSGDNGIMLREVGAGSIQANISFSDITDVDSNGIEMKTTGYPGAYAAHRLDFEATDCSSCEDNGIKVKINEPGQLEVFGGGGSSCHSNDKHGIAIEANGTDIPYLSISNSYLTSNDLDGINVETATIYSAFSGCVIIHNQSEGVRLLAGPTPIHPKSTFGITGTPAFFQGYQLILWRPDPDNPGELLDWHVSLF